MQETQERGDGLFPVTLQIQIHTFVAKPPLDSFDRFATQAIAISLLLSGHHHLKLHLPGKHLQLWMMVNLT